MNVVFHPIFFHQRSINVLLIQAKSENSPNYPTITNMKLMCVIHSVFNPNILFYSKENIMKQGTKVKTEDRIRTDDKIIFNQNEIEIIIFV